MTHPRALLIDYGGVLTESMTEWIGRSCDGFGLDTPRLLASIFGDTAEDGPFGSLERGEITRQEFGLALGPVLNAHRLDPLAPEIDGPAWVEQISQLKAIVDLRMVKAADAVAATGVPVVLLSNSWGPPEAYPWERLPAFTATVISGVEGVRKPSPAIYELAAERAGVPPRDCLFVDDAAINLPPAESLGMTTIHHRDTPATIEALVAYFPKIAAIM